MTGKKFKIHIFFKFVLCSCDFDIFGVSIGLATKFHANDILLFRLRSLLDQKFTDQESTESVSGSWPLWQPCCENNPNDIGYMKYTNFSLCKFVNIQALFQGRFQKFLRTLLIQKHINITYVYDAVRDEIL